MTLSRVYGARSPVGLGKSSSRAIDYLRAVYILGGLPSKDFVKFSLLAKTLKVSPSTVSIMTRRLESKGLLEVAPNTGVRLTKKGLVLLSEFLWKAAIVEVLLQRAGIALENCKNLGISVAVGISLEDAWRLYNALGRPERCPHNKPIIPPNKVNEDNAYEIANCCGIQIN
ncbi:MAG: metal-dependent transcriptional regulator [Aeropyrum sp.]|nr:metal-dependent transcriptional regulator [Aeropyrum sp.]